MKKKMSGRSYRGHGRRTKYAGGVRLERPSLVPLRAVRNDVAGKTR